MRRILERPYRTEAMPHPFARRIFSILAVFVCVANVTAHAAALVGPTSRVEPQPGTAIGPDALKAEYRRPATIPFPRHNPYTPGKAMLGRMLFFDTRLSGTGSLACASCHN